MTIERKEHAEEWPRRELTNYSRLQLLEDVTRYRLVSMDNAQPWCLRCNHADVDHTIWKNTGLGLCEECGFRVRLTGTYAGRLAVEEILAGMIPVRYRQFEFGDFVAYNESLTRLQSHVVTWSQRLARDETAGSLYIWSGPGKHGTGNGNGKTSQLYASFKYAARRRGLPHSTGIGYDSLDELNLNLRTFAYDFHAAVIQPFRQALARGKKMIPIRPFMPALGGRGSMYDFRTVDEFVVLVLGQVPLLYLDDVGAHGDGQMAREFYDLLFDARAANSRPTFITSNFSPDELASRIGSRPVSRLLRTNCRVIEVQAPDYSKVRHRLRPTPRGQQGAAS